MFVKDSGTLDNKMRLLPHKSLTFKNQNSFRSIRKGNIDLHKNLWENYVTGMEFNYYCSKI